MAVSIVIGVGLGIAYGLTSFLMFVIAMRLQQNGFMVVALGGMLVRMTVGLAAVALITTRLPVEQAPFFLGFIGTFALALALEIIAVHKGYALLIRRGKNA